MEQAVPRHDRLLTEAIERHGGAVFKQVGDGLCAAFEEPIGAIEAAVEAQRALAAETWPEELPQSLRSRMGIHTGTAREQDGDYLGPALNRVARLMGAGHGGQVLLSAATERLARDALPESMRTLDLGSHRLRDLATQEQVFQVCHPDLETTFPPLKSVESMPGNLPLQVTRFIGRAEVLAQLAHAVLDNRFVTLTGVGGVGKTRLALETATEVLPNYVDGAWLVELAPIGDPDAVPHAVAAIVGAQDLPGRTTTESVIEALRPRQCLVILDNCEHVLSAAGNLVEEVLRACPQVTVFATSREGLGIPGERVWPVMSLAVPGADGAADPEELRGIASVELFLDRATAARRDFLLTADNAAAVAEICKRLDGVALALELAAARVRSMTVSEIAARLDERFRLLRSGRRTAMERHQTLRATVEWSYGLLAEDERIVFDRLSVFAGGFILEAAERVCAGGDIDEFDVADLVASLVEKSMVGIEEQPDGTTRYSTLETIRQFGEEQLLERGDATEVGGQHARYFAELAARCFDGTRGTNEARWVEVASLEFDNFRAAHAWGMANGDATIALSIPVDLEWFASWRMRGEVFTWLFAALELPEAASSPRYADALAMGAFNSGMNADFELADDLAARALELGPSPEHTFLAHYGRGSRGFSEDLRDAVDHFLAGEAAARDEGDRLGEGFGAAARALIVTYQGNPEAGAEIAGAAKELADQTGNPSIRAMASYTLGEVLQELDPARSEVALETAIELARSVNNRFVVGITLVALSSVKARRGNDVEATGALADALTEFRRRGVPRQVYVALRNVVEQFARMGIYEQAAVLHGHTESDTAVGASWGAQAERLAVVRRDGEAALGDGWAVAEARGMAMDQDEAVAYALHEIQALREDAVNSSASTA